MLLSRQYVMAEKDSDTTSIFPLHSIYSIKKLFVLSKSTIDIFLLMVAHLDPPF